MLSFPCKPILQVAKVEKAVLSTTVKARERQKKKDAEKQKNEAAKEGELNL